MVIKEDGTKWACQSCLKGHRVSGCTHTDRPLQFVPKKGRPVTQCPHCRVERKKRSAHVKCDCGEKQHPKEKCIHLRNAEVAHAEVANELPPVPESQEPASPLCCCSHGEKCVCFTAKIGPEHGHDHHSSRSKPRLMTTQSEGHLTVFANGHHKPVHRNNNAAHDANMPYRVRKPHTAHAAHGIHAAGRRSVDSLVSADTATAASFEPIKQMAVGPVDSDNAVDTEPAAPEMMFDAFAIPTDTMAPSGTDDFFAMQTENVFQSKEPAGMSHPQSAQSDTSGDFNWSTFDWGTFGTMENTQPALTYASSNTISEFGDHTPPDESGPAFNLAANNVLAESSTQAPLSNAPMNFGLSDRLDEIPPNRWSLPPSFGGGLNSDRFAELMAGFEFGAAEEGNELSEGEGDLFQGLDFNEIATASAADQGGARLPPSLPSFAPPMYISRDGKNQPAPPDPWTHGSVSSSMQFNDQALETAAGPDIANFGFTSNGEVQSPYRQDQSDTFFGLECAATIDFSQDFAPSDIRETWSS